ncbi:hypothetical protein K6V98_01065 [Collinsella sp. AGMB00827]|uniref:Uncharacterized protein n=1 Tax=Collinsella ureilytica TaxID=2869515 RepID=A0ABS7MIV2_9ACTN|nr:hypothetical protein [Collinsella urealyticum]MBY4796958.1 hypothetical protein [Collinsella urealyticum]
MKIKNMFWNPFVAAVIIPWVVLGIILIARTAGALLIGNLSFFLLVISRICIVVIAVEICLFAFMMFEPIVLRLLAVAGTILIIFLALHNPLLDLFYLTNPIQANIMVTNTRYSKQFVSYSIFYHLDGTDDSGQKLSFRIDRASYERLRQHKNLRIHLVYLPHTLHVLAIKY